VQSFTPLTVAISTTPSNCGQSNGGACATPGGGLGPYTYIWNDSAVTQAACMSGVPAGSYSVDVTDANGCVVTAVANINDITAPTLAVVSHTDLLCFGMANATATTTISGGVTPYNIIWTPGGQTVQNPTNFTGGVNTMTVTDAAGCVSAISVTILEPPAINHAIIALTNVSCFGACNGTATLSANGGTGALTYLWNDPAAQTTPSVSGLCAGNYNVLITDANGCTALDSLTIIAQPSTLAISSSAATNVTCFGNANGSITTTETGGTPFYTFAWTPAGGAAPVATGLSPGTYTLTVTDQNGCSTSQNWTITEPPLLTNASSFASATCSQANGSATITPAGGSPAYTYQWNDPAFQTTPTATGLMAGTYSVLVTDTHGCTTTQSYVVNDLSGPVIDTMTSTPVLCFSGSTGSATVVLTPGTGTLPLTYDWNPGSQVNSTATSLTAGTYSVIVTDANGCSATGVVAVTEPPLLQLFVSQNDTICYGDTTSVYATASGGSPAYNYFWVGASGAGFSGGGPHLVNPPATVMYTALVLDANGCSAGPLDMYVYVKPPLSVVASDTAICAGDAAMIWATGSGGAGAGYTYSWDNGSTNASQTVTPPGVTNYIVTVSDGCSAPASDTSTVSINPGSIGILQGLPTEGCDPLTVTFVGGSNNGVSYLWDFGDGHTGTGTNTSNTYTVAGTYDVTLTITTAAGCTTLIDSIDYVTVYPLPNAAFTATPNPVSSLSPFVSFFDQSTAAITSWSWNFGDVTTTADTSSAQNPVYQYPQAASNLVTLIVMNQYGCYDTAQAIVDVIDDFVFYAPNAFTPDGDGLNDVFLPKGIGFDFDTFNMMIFDRWGNLIYQQEEYGKGWDGRAKGGSEIAQIDVYVWKVSLKDNQGHPHKYIGHVSIVK
jgi:gliding motility-associated-like protein